MNLPTAEDKAKTDVLHPANSLPHSVVRQLEHPERKLTLLFIATSGEFAFISTFLGAVMLASLSGVSVVFGISLFPAHPFLQIYGFIAEFVMGVSFSLLPRFKVSRVPSLGLGFTSYIFSTSSNVLFLASAILSTYSVILSSAGASLILLAAIAFAAEVFLLASRHGGGFPETNPLIMLSSSSLVLISLALLLEETGFISTDPFSTQMILLALVGFAGSMIYSVAIRSVSFRNPIIERGWQN